MRGIVSIDGVSITLTDPDTLGHTSPETVERGLEPG
jgi:hypothetical protein